MPETLPRLRFNLEFMPSPAPDRPGLLIRDSYHYSDATLIFPPPLIPCLEAFDGNHTELDLRAVLVDITGDLQVGDLAANIIQTLSGSGFLDNDIYHDLREKRHRAFAELPLRQPVHAGSAYPERPEALTETMRRYMNGASAAADGLIGIAAPHVSPEGGWRSYQSAYRLVGQQYRDRTFVILGTSHYGEPERFGLTRKPFVTPFGQAVTDLALLDRLAARAAPAILMEDYCHSIEHSIEFQVVFLQSLFGPNIRILPVLCGSFARAIYEGGKPEDSEEVRCFFETLGEIAAAESGRIFWVLGIDMAHMGSRYQDALPAVADQGLMTEVAERDKMRIDRMQAGDATGFWDLVQENHDDLKWCGSSPVYTFLKAVPGARGTLQRYEQWNIDQESVVSFAGMSFAAGA